ncbi:MAG: phosphoenolpyruvate--protein phosphotransferase [Deltaproteobacteria bacterium]|nr:phosphoenolpyruvate--protein phosphotransferase [Deltaproteobacteria bacterium]
METERTQTDTLHGIGASPGIVMGRAYHIDRAEVRIFYHYLLDESRVDNEIKRFMDAAEWIKEELRKAKESIPAELKDHVYVLDTHMLILSDHNFFDAVIDQIRIGHINAEWAVKKTVTKIQESFKKIEDDYLRERVLDIGQVGQRLLRVLLGSPSGSLKDIADKVIIVAHDLTPEDMTQIKANRVQGIITDIGGRTSHMAIMAQSLEIPAVVGLRRASEVIVTGDHLILDGGAGLVIINPDAETIQRYQERKVRFELYQEHVHGQSRLPAVTRDGQEISIMANLEMIAEAAAALDYGAEGVGLYRTEYHYLASAKLPQEDELFENYREVVESMKPRPVTIRTLDVGGDKVAGYMDMKPEANPVLGLRAIRFCLREPEIFKTQLRAILRASNYGWVKILFPMISSVSEMRAVKNIYHQVCQEMDRQQIPFDKSISLGIMIEIPSAVIMADALAKEVEFFSIGSNDLIQYTMAIDRVNEYVAHMYKPFHPAILRILHQLVKTSEQSGIKLSICGEMAGDPMCLPILLGLGITDLSMNAFSIPIIKQIIRETSYSESKEFFKRIFKCETSGQVNTLVFEHMSRILSRDLMNQIFNHPGSGDQSSS